jgi:hypothetical protein
VCNEQPKDQTQNCPCSNQPQTSSDHQTRNVTPDCSQRQAHADLVSSLRYQKSNDSVEPYERKGEACRGEEVDEQGLESWLIGELAHSLAKGGDFHRQDWLVVALGEPNSPVTCWPATLVTASKFTKRFREEPIVVRAASLHF